MVGALMRRANEPAVAAPKTGIVAMSPNQRNVVTGAVVLFALGTLAWMVMTFSGQAMRLFKPKATPVAFVSDRADGLDDGSPVLFHGVQVGKVSGVRRASDNIHIQIDGEIDNTPPLPSNLEGQIKAQSQLGSASQIDLQVDGAPTGQLAAGAKIKIHYAPFSLLPPEATDLLAQVRQQEMVKHMDEAVLSLKKQIDHAGVMMDSVQKLIGDPQLQADFRQTVANVRSATDRADKLAAELQTLTANATSTVSDIQKTVGDLRGTVTKTNASIDTLSRQMGSDLDRLGLVFHQFEEISEKINKGKGTAGALLNDPKLFDEMANTAKELNTVSATLARLVDQWEHEGVYIKLNK